MPSGASAAASVVESRWGSISCAAWRSRQRQQTRNSVSVNSPPRLATGPAGATHLLQAAELDQPGHLQDPHLVRNPSKPRLRTFVCCDERDEPKHLVEPAAAAGQWACREPGGRRSPAWRVEHRALSTHGQTVKKSTTNHALMSMRARRESSAAVDQLGYGGGLWRRWSLALPGIQSIPPPVPSPSPRYNLHLHWEGQLFRIFALLVTRIPAAGAVRVLILPAVRDSDAVWAVIAHCRKPTREAFKTQKVPSMSAALAHP